jgi:AcrR family transcriptional regulator
MELADKILFRAEKLFLRYGFKSITMDDLANELGISKKTLYQHIDNKSDLVDKITEQYILRQKISMDEVSKNAKDAIHEMLLIAKHVIQLLRRMQPTTMYDLKKYYRESWMKIDSFHMIHVYQMIKANILKGIKEGLYREQADADIIAKLYVGKTMILTDETMFPLRDYDREKLFREYIKYHIHGIASAKGIEIFKKYQKSLIS